VIYLGGDSEPQCKATKCFLDILGALTPITTYMGMLCGRTVWYRNALNGRLEKDISNCNGEVHKIVSGKTELSLAECGQLAPALEARAYLEALKVSLLQLDYEELTEFKREKHFVRSLWVLYEYAVCLDEIRPELRYVEIFLDILADHISDRMEIWFFEQERSLLGVGNIPCLEDYVEVRRNIMRYLLSEHMQKLIVTNRIENLAGRTMNLCICCDARWAPLLKELGVRACRTNSDWSQ